jgi:transposase
MAYIIKKRARGGTYYYAAQSARVNGKPRIVWQKYLGTLEEIIKKSDSDNTSLGSNKEAVIFDAGGVAAMLRIADEIQLTKIIDEIIPKNGKGPSIGQYILLAAINRILAPCSKSQMPDWYENTILFPLWKYPKEDFNSQRFWDHMDLFSEENINEIQEKIVFHMKDSFKINPRIILYDTTNFFSYIATNNTRNTIAQRGRQKQKRNDLRQIGLALLVSEEFQIPLFHRAYQGNLTDQGLFPKTIAEIKKSYAKVFDDKLETAQSTLVYDKGNISENAQEGLIISQQNFICAIPKQLLPELFETPIERFQQVHSMSGTKALSFLDVKIWNSKLKAVLVYTESFFITDLTDLTQTLQKCEKKLRDLNQSFSKWEKKPHHKSCPTLQSAKKSAQEIINLQHVKEIISIDVVIENKIPFINYSVDQSKLDMIAKHQLGRTLLITSRLEWSETEVISAYRGLNRIESAFKHMKHRNFLHWYPSFHWTDQKIHVHALYCVLALLLASLAHKKIVEQGMDMTLLNMVEELSDIREVAVIHSKDDKSKQKDEIIISKMTSQQKKLVEILGIQKYFIGTTKSIAQPTDV